jgi:hypothetical protein
LGQGREVGKSRDVQIAALGEHVEGDEDFVEEVGADWLLLVGSLLD